MNARQGREKKKKKKKKKGSQETRAIRERMSLFR